MASLAAGSNITLTLGAYDSVSVEVPGGGACAVEYPVGTRIAYVNGGSRVFGPYPFGGSVKLTAEGVAVQYDSVDGTLPPDLDESERSALQALVSKAGNVQTPGARALNAGVLMADADRLLVTRGRALVRWNSSAGIGNGAVLATMAEAQMWEPSLGNCIKLVGKAGSGSRPYARQAIVGSAAASGSLSGLLVQVKGPYRNGVSFVPMRVKVESDNTGGNWFGATFAVPADGLEHWIFIGIGNAAAVGTFVAGTSTIAYVTVEDRNDAVNIGYDGLLDGESMYVGQVYLNPKGRAKAMIRFDDSLADLTVASQSFAADGVTQAWSAKSLLDRYGYRGCTFNLSRRIGTSNSAATHTTWAALKALHDAGWDNCVQTHTDPVNAANSGARLLGPFGYADKALSAVDTSTDTITTAAAHNISQGAVYWGHPIVFTGGDLPAPLLAGVVYWPRATAGTTMTLHPTEVDSIANTNKIDLTTTGTPATCTYRYAGSANDSSAILADYNQCRDLLIANGMERGARIIALNQGAWDPYVAQAIISGGYRMTLGIRGGGGGGGNYARLAVGESGDSGSTAGVGGPWLTLPSAIQTDGAGTPTAATVRAYVQTCVAAGAIFSNYHHAITTTNGLVLDAYLDELRIQHAAGLLDICTPSEVADYLDAFKPVMAPVTGTAI